MLANVKHKQTWGFSTLLLPFVLMCIIYTKYLTICDQDVNHEFYFIFWQNLTLITLIGMIQNN